MAKASAVRPYLLDYSFNKNLRFVKFSFLKKEVLNIFMQLSRYEDKKVLVEMRRIELLTPCLQGRCSPS